MVDYRKEWRAVLSFFLGCIVFALLTALPIFGDQSYLENPDLHLEIRQTIYWTCVIISFVLLYKMTPKELFSNAVISLFGPVFLMTLGFTRLLYKLFPIKKVEDNG